MTSPKKLPTVIDGEASVVPDASNGNASNQQKDDTPSMFPVVVRKVLGGFGTKHVILPNQELSNTEIARLPQSENDKYLTLPANVDPGIVGKVKSARNKLRYWRWNPFSAWNRKVDQLTRTESWEYQREIHIQRWSGLAHGYKTLFGHVLAMFRRPKNEPPRYLTFDDMLFEQKIDEKELQRLIKMRQNQIRAFYFFMAVPFLSACFFIYHHMVWMFILNVWMFMMLGVINLLFTIELWRLKNRCLGGFKQWLKASQ